LSVCFGEGNVERFWGVGDTRMVLNRRVDEREGANNRKLHDPQGQLVLFQRKFNKNRKEITGKDCIVTHFDNGLAGLPK